jgi:peptidoglycan pentaglycine glycine transferase (the first glycine)
MRFGYIDEPKKEEWEKLVARNPASGFMQSFFWTNFVNLLGWPTFKIGIFEKNNLIGGAVITKFTEDNEHNYLYISEGPVIPYGLPESEKLFENLISEIDKIADLKGEKLTSHLRIDPKLTTFPKYFRRFQKAPIDLEPMRTLIIDLTLSKDQILAQMKPKGRYNIKVAQRYGLKVTSSDLKSGLKDFLKFYHQTVNRKQFEGKDEKYFIDLATAADNSKNAKFFFVKDQNNILAVALVIFYGKMATFLFGASSDVSREKMAPYLLHWEIICQAKEMGFKEYDFYGIVPDENDLNHPWQGFTTFKKKFGGKEIKNIGAYDFVYNQKLYKEYLRKNNEA